MDNKKADEYNQSYQQSQISLLLELNRNLNTVKKIQMFYFVITIIELVAVILTVVIGVILVATGTGTS